MGNKFRKELSEEILSLTPKEGRSRWLLSPRFGKSKLAIDLIKRDKPKKVLWVTPFTRLAKVSIPEEFIKWKAKSYLGKVTTVTWRSLDKVKGHFDLVILDEEQFITPKNSITLLNGELTFDSMVSMTGTPSKNKEKLWLLGILGLKTVYDFNIDEAVETNILADYGINVIEVPLSFEKSIHIKTKKADFMTSEAKNYLYVDSQYEKAKVSNPSKAKYLALNRMNIIYNSPSKTSAARFLGDKLKGRKMFFCANSSQASKISKFTYNSKTDDKHFNQFLEGKIEEIALVHKGGVGDTYKDVKHLIIVQADSDVNGSTSQKIARVLLKQENYKAKIWILVLKHTQDEQWVSLTLKNFNDKKINVKTLKEFEDENKQTD